ncbi:hypothetical protein NDU88_007715 [Pleurodeles waltl]|uniref:Uncharacterized protein n=1 Tax=Pleurodeles waltl TaxID=8319 RepID=A0AAV7VV74_PLEWA|nr:hypothetical protein NDU88_007715 [Pleurodeles waltl]
MLGTQGPYQFKSRSQKQSKALFVPRSSSVLYRLFCGAGKLPHMFIPFPQAFLARAGLARAPLSLAVPTVPNASDWHFSVRPSETRSLLVPYLILRHSGALCLFSSCSGRQ